MVRMSSHVALPVPASHRVGSGVWPTVRTTDAHCSSAWSMTSADQIRSGRLQAEAQVPSANQIAETYGIAQMTAQRALRELQNQGRIYAIQGRGTYVHPTAVARLRNAEQQPAVVPITDQGTDDREQARLDTTRGHPNPGSDPSTRQRRRARPQTRPPGLRRRPRRPPRPTRRTRRLPTDHTDTDRPTQDHPNPPTDPTMIASWLKLAIQRTYQERPASRARTRSGLRPRAHAKKPATQRHPVS